jgi:hypothetical protein
MVSFIHKLSKTLTDKAKKIKDKAIDLLPFKDTEVSYEALYSKNIIKKKDCQWYINCENARKLKFIISDYLSDIKNKSTINGLDGLEDTEVVDITTKPSANLNKYKVVVTADNTDRGIIKTINNNTNNKNFLNLNINNLCIKSDKEYKNCKKYLDYEPVFFTYKNKKLYTGLYKEFINEPIDDNICKVLITCKNAIKLAKEIKNINDEKIIYTSDTLKKIKIKVYSKYSLIKLGAKIESIDPKNLSFNIKYDDEKTSIINDGSKFNFVSLCITDETYTKYNECGDINSLKSVEHKKPKEEKIEEKKEEKIEEKKEEDKPPSIPEAPLIVHMPKAPIPEAPPFGPVSKAPIPEAPPFGPVSKAPIPEAPQFGPVSKAPIPEAPQFGPVSKAPIPEAPPFGPVSKAPIAPLIVHMPKASIPEAKPKYKTAGSDFLTEIQNKKELKKVPIKDPIINPLANPLKTLQPPSDFLKKTQETIEKKQALADQKARNESNLKIHLPVDAGEWDDPIPDPKAKLEPKLVPKLEPKLVPKLEPKLVPKLEPKLVPKLEPKQVPKPEPKLVPKPEPQVINKQPLIDVINKYGTALRGNDESEDESPGDFHGGYLRKYLKYKSKYLKMKHK